MNNIYFYDSVKKSKIKFEPIEKNSVKIYVCGPTVYDNTHLGHARSAIAFDLLHRILKLNDYKVIMTKNFTDIDDKIIKKMQESNKTLEEITKKYITLYKNDMKELNILDNTFEPKATDNIEIMQEMILELIKKDLAYKTSDSIYFDTSKDNLYGTISNKKSDENSVSRVEENLEKRNLADFALWKFAKEKDVSYKASFGDGRPGWHIECSAMIHKHLAYKDKEFQIDIHAGGADLLFPHHENEASQTRCFSGQNLSKYWMHNGFVNINGEKMSKSLGNSFFLKDILEKYNGEIVRFYLMSVHYRSDISFNEEDLISSKKRLDKIYRLKKRVYEVDFIENKNKFTNDILTALNDDINISVALAIVDDMINISNDKLDLNPKDKNLKKEINSNLSFLNKALGILNIDAYKYFQLGINDDEKNNIENMINKRNEAKKNKDFALADKIRGELKSMNIILMDTAKGTFWEKL